MEAELRRRLRMELAQARSLSEGGQLDDATLAEIVARAIASALGWHSESPQHTRNATASSRGWRPAAGPRGGGPPREVEEAPRRPPYRPREPAYEEPYQDEEYRPRRRGGQPPRYQQRGPRPGGRRPPMGRGGGGGFGQRKPRRGG